MNPVIRNDNPLPAGPRALLALAVLSFVWMAVVLLTGGIDVTIAGLRIRATEWLDGALVSFVAALFFLRTQRRARSPAASDMATASRFRWRSASGAGLAAILVVAAVVRVWGLRFGLPHPDARPDEGAVAAIAGGFSTGHFEPPGFVWPPFYILLVAAVLWLLFVKSGPMLARFGIHVAQPSTISVPTERIVARMISATTGVLSVWLIFRTADRLFDRATAWIAAVFLALAFLHVRDSHFGVTDITMTGMVLAAFLLIVRFDDSGRFSDLAVAAVVSGCAIATKYNAALLVLPAGYAVMTHPARQSAGARFWWLSAFFGLMLVTFFAVCPYALITPGKFVSDVLFNSRHLAEGQGPDLGRGWIYHLTTTLRYGLGLPLLSAGIAGVPLVLWREKRRGVLLVIYPLAYYIVIGSGRTVFARYILPVVPFLCLTGAYTVVVATRWVSTAVRRPQWSPWFAAALTAVAILPSTLSAVAFDRVLAREDTRVTARRWIELRFAPGTSLAQWGQPNAQVYADFEITYRLSPIIRSERPTLVVIASAPTNPLPDLHEFLPFLEREYELAFVQDVVPEHDPANVYDLQDEFFLPLTGFHRIQRPGPNLRIFVRR